MSELFDGAFMHKAPVLSEIISFQKIYIDPAQFELEPDTEIKKHPSSNPEQGLSLDYKSIKFPEVFTMPQDDFHAQIMKMLSMKIEEERLNREMAQAASRLPGAWELVRCPGCIERGVRPTFPERLHSVIAHLNDYHKWDRNRIADWLDELADAGQINIDF